MSKHFALAPRSACGRPHLSGRGVWLPAVLLCLSALTLATQPALAEPEIESPARHDLILVENPGLDPTALISGGYDVHRIKPGSYAEIFATPADQERLRSEGYRFKVLQADLESMYAARSKGIGFGDFHTYSETVDKLDALHALYPTLTTAKVSIGTSHQGNYLWMMKVSDNPNVDEDEPEVLFDGAHHAREPMSTEMCLMLIEYLCANYDSDPYVRWLVDEREIHVVPIVNPDGYLYNEQTSPLGGGMWRKNRRNNGDGSYGVDPNRNYTYQWGCCGGSSGVPSSETYRGPYAGSEPEVQAMMTFISGRHFTVAQSYHTYANITLYPWGYTSSSTPDNNIFLGVAAAMCATNGYEYGQPPALLYVVDGGAIDWAYGNQTLKPKIFAFSNEIGSSNDGFWPLDSRIPALFQDNIGAALYLIEAAGVGFQLQNMAVAGGNNNGRLDPGETAFLSFSLQNSAVMMTAQGVHVTMLSNDSYALFPSPHAVIGSLAPRGLWTTTPSTFPLSVDAACPNGHVVHGTARVAWDGGMLDLPFALPVGTPSTLFTDDFESGVTNWTRTGSWNVTTASYHSPTRSLTDTPGGNYTNNSNTSATLATPLNFSTVSVPDVVFWHRYTTEANWDYCYVEASSDGTNWSALESYNGTQAAWLQRTVSLAAFAGQPAVRIRFRLQTDTSVTYDGWYIDDVQIRGYATANTPPTAPMALAPPEGAHVSDPVVLTVLNATDSDGPDPLTYGFKIYSDALTGQPVLETSGVAEGAGETSWTVPDGALSTLKSATPYYWRAFADDGASRGDLSATASFIFDTMSGLPGDAVGPFLSAVPGTGSTAFTFAARRTGRATLAIFNLRGERVATVFTGDVNGPASANWNQRDDSGAAVASGVYFARLVGPETELAVKLIVVK